MKDRILELRAEGKTYSEIKKELGCSKATISYHCGNNQKEKTNKRNRDNRTDICECGNSKYISASLCSKCTNSTNRNSTIDKTLADFEKLYKNNSRYFTVRKYARLTLIEAGIEKKCKICGFNHYVEACHIKAISSFPKDTKVSVVNDINNLVYLCPNHHVMLDKGLITL